MASKTLGPKEFTHVVEEYAKHYAYVIYPKIKERRLATEPCEFPLVQIYLNQPPKLDWLPVELLSFEGAEFAEATAQLLQCRPATATERLRFSNDSFPWTRLDFILQLDHENRTQGVPTRVRHINVMRFVWSLHYSLAKSRSRLLTQISWRLFRKCSLLYFLASLQDLSMRKLLHLSLQSMSKNDSLIDVKQ